MARSRRRAASGSPNTDPSAGKTLEDGNPTSLDAVLASGIQGSIPESFSDAVAQLVEDAGAAMAGSISPEIVAIMERVVAQLDHCPDYAREDARRCVNSVLWSMLRFLDLRMDMTKGNDPGSRYLFAETERASPKSKAATKPAVNNTAKVTEPRDHFERSIQLDCHKFLYSALGKTTKVEQSDVAGGRADIYIERDHVRLVIEVKREDKDASHGALLRAYGAQATDYSNTSIRIGFLLVLDRSRPDGSSGHIDEKVSVQTVTKHGDSVPRTLVIVVMPGKRKRPSELTTPKCKSWKATRLRPG